MKGKDYAISVVRLIAFCMVVICHICNFYNNELAYWFNCGVQMFLLISGFLYGQRGIIPWKAFYKRNLPNILIDYYLYLAIMIPIYLLVIHQSISVSDYINLLLGIGTDIPGMGHLWYISTILVCYLITPFVSQMIYPKTKWISLAVLLVFIEILFIALPGFTGAWINCYIIGLLVGKYYSSTSNKDKLLARILIVSIPCATIICGIEVLLKYIVHYPMAGVIGRGMNTIFHYGHIALAFIIFVGLVLLIHKYFARSIEHKFLELTDKYSYDAYLVHLFFVLGPYSFFIGRNNIPDIAGGVFC